jgi:hypothetical protein
VGAGELTAPKEEQLDLFRDEGRRRNRRLDAALDAIQDRFGGGAIHRGGAPRVED